MQEREQLHSGADDHGVQGGRGCDAADVDRPDVKPISCKVRRRRMAKVCVCVCVCVCVICVCIERSCLHAIFQHLLLLLLCV